MLVLRMIAPAINLKCSNYSSSFLRHFYCASLTTDIYGTRLVPLMLLRKTAKKKTLLYNSLSTKLISQKNYFLMQKIIRQEKY